MRIVVASVQTPFLFGGAEVLADGLIKALVGAGHEVELVKFPFIPSEPERIPDQMLACALTPLESVAGVPIDLVIALKFPAYLIAHANKVVWLLHQHRHAYDLWEDPLGGLRKAPRGRRVRDIIQRADRKMCSEAKRLFTLSQTVSDRLMRFLQIQSQPLYHPPADAELFYSAEPAGDYLFFPSRILPNKRQELVLRALALTHTPVRLKFSGTADRPTYGGELKQLGRKLRVDSRVEWTGFLSQQEKRDMYARALGVVFPPLDEDYGYITLEAMLASKPVITCEDSGGPLEFLRPNETGLITAPEAPALAAAMDTIWQDRPLAIKMGRAARQHYEGLDLSWSNVVKHLLR
jgi:glycosyltransferase involved in cell wall biosynthesis